MQFLIPCIQYTGCLLSQRVKMILFFITFIPSVSDTSPRKALKVSLALTPQLACTQGCIVTHTSHGTLWLYFYMSSFIKLHFKRYNKFLEPPLKYSAKTGNSTFSSRHMTNMILNRALTHCYTRLNEAPHSNRELSGMCKNC